MFEVVNEVIQEFLKIHPLGDTYPSGMTRFFKMLSDSDWENFYDEAVEFANDGDSDVRNKLQKNLRNTTKEKFKKEMNSIIIDLKEKTAESIDLYTICDWYNLVKNRDAFKIVDKRIGNGIPNAMLSGLYKNLINGKASQISTNNNQVDTWVGRVPSKVSFEKMANESVYQIFFNALNVGDLSEYNTIDEISNNNEKFLTENGNIKMNDRKCLWQFANEINVGDIIYITHSSQPILAKARVTGEYYYDPSTATHKIPVVYNLEFTGNTEVKFTQKTLTRISNNLQDIEQIENDILNNNHSLMKVDFIETGYKQLIIDGAPGTGKSYGVNQEVKKNHINHERVTFYSDYEYHNFIGSILPKLNGETVTYEFVKGPFTKILNDALSNPEDKHYLIVEELTRGNAAAIFGDIFQLLDRDEEGWSEYPITHNNILESLDPEVRTFLENEYGSKIVLPPNLSIICTINSSDQNVYPLDTAFKRRFDYKIESTNVHSDFVDYKIKFGTDTTVSWQDFYQKLNKYILVDLRLKEDKQVGPYFIKNHKGNNKKLESIQTKLAMYMWNDLHKVHTISNKTIFEDVYTLYEVDNLFRTGSREQILNVLSEEFKQCLNLNDVSDLTE